MRKLENLANEEGAPTQTDMALLTGYLRQGNTGKALEVARGMVKKSPNDPMAHQALGSVPGAEQGIARGARRVRQVARTQLHVHAGGGEPRATRSAGRQDRPRRGRDSRRVLAKDPKNTAALMGLADVMERAKAPSAEIIAVLQRAIAAQPDCSRYPAGADQPLPARPRCAGRTHRGTGSVGCAADRIPRILDALGRAQLAAGESNQAIETFNRLAAAEPQSPVPLQRLAGVYASRKEPDRAIDALVRAQKLAPADASIARDLAVLYLANGKNDEALKQAKALQASAPKSAGGFRAGRRRSSAGEAIGGRGEGATETD